MFDYFGNEIKGGKTPTEGGSATQKGKNCCWLKAARQAAVASLCQSCWDVLSAVPLNLNRFIWLHLLVLFTLSHVYPLVLWTVNSCCVSLCVVTLICFLSIILHLWITSYYVNVYIFLWWETTNLSCSFSTVYIYTHTHWQICIYSI